MSQTSKAETDIHNELSTLRADFRRSPGDVPGQLERVGRRCRESGRHHKLEAVLESLPKEFLQDGLVLY